MNPLTLSKVLSTKSIKLAVPMALFGNTLLPATKIWYMKEFFILEN
jgi:hypothetical protein